MKKNLLGLLAFASVFSASAQECEHGGCSAESHIPGPVIIHSKSTKKTIAGHFIGTMHEHSNFSDGYPGTTPADYYNSGSANGFDFVFGSDHSDNFNLPIGLHSDCASEQLLDCINIDPMSPLDGILKWKTTADMQAAAQSSEFLAIRGFEWTSDRTGHINVYFTQNITNAKADGGYVDISLFYTWLSTDPMVIPQLGELLGGVGGADGVAVFNHPGDKKLSDQDPAYNWNNFAFDAKAEPFMVGMELFNSGSDYASGDKAFYQEALDKGWHIGAVGTEDHHETDWNNNSDPKTVFIADGLTQADFLAAMKRRSFYAVRDHGLRMDYHTAAGAQMGSQLVKKTGSIVTLIAEIESDNVSKIELVTNTGTILTTTDGKTMKYPVEVSDSEKYYYLRATDSTGRSMAYSSPIWVKGGGTEIDENVGITVQNISKDAIFPNPITKGNELNFTSGFSGKAQVIVKNLLGQDVLNTSTTLSKGSNKLLSSEQMQLETGIYFIQIDHSSFSTVQQIVVR